MFRRPATKKSYLVAGRTIVIETADDWTHRVVSEIFSGWFFRLVAHEISPVPNATIRIHCRADRPTIPSNLPSFAITSGGTCFTDEKSYYLKFKDALVFFDAGSQVDLWVARPYEASSSEFVQLLSQALSPALRRAGAFEIHSAGVIAPHAKSAIMIAGASGSGKSTLTTQLAKSAWDYLSDDILLLTDAGEDLQMQAFRRFFALTDDTLTAVQLPINSGVDASNSKQRIHPQEHFNRATVQQARPGAIVFPKITMHEDSQIKALSPGETMSRLLRLCPWASYDKATSVEHLRILGRLAISSNGFDLLAGTDILSDSNLTAQLFSNITVSAD